MIAGRKGWKTTLQKFKKSSTHKLHWFHCASVGEFEQARPIIEKLREDSCQIVITFFSPSGFELRKNYKWADLVMYLPLDIPSYARFFVRSLKPDVAIFVKYDFWFNMMNEIHLAGIKSAVISTYIPNGHWLMKMPGKIMAHRLNQFQKLFLQDESTLLNLKKLNIRNLEVVGDTRFDRVIGNKSVHFRNEAIQKFKGSNKLVVVGSSWPQDEEIYMPFITKWPDVKWLIAPHEISAKKVRQWQTEFGPSMVKWSETYSDEELISAKVFFLDTVGLLSKVYAYADVAYVGGGFGSAVHNTLEPAVFGVPVIFGPKNERFLEIQELKLIEPRFEVHNSTDLIFALELALFSEKLRETYREKIYRYFQAQHGASLKVLDWILEK